MIEAAKQLQFTKSKTAQKNEQKTKTQEAKGAKKKKNKSEKQVEFALFNALAVSMFDLTDQYVF